MLKASERMISLKKKKKKDEARKRWLRNYV